MNNRGTKSTCIKDPQPKSAAQQRTSKINITALLNRILLVEMWRNLSEIYSITLHWHTDMTDILCNRHKYNYYLHRVTESPHWLPHISIPPSPTPHPPTQPPPSLSPSSPPFHTLPTPHPPQSDTHYARTHAPHARTDWERARKKTKPATAAAWSSESRFPWALLIALIWELQ